MARNSLITSEIIEEICNRICGGDSLNAICKPKDITETDEPELVKIPCKATVFSWLLKAYDKDSNPLYKEFLDRYTQARKIQAEYYIDQVFDIANNGSNDWMERNDPDNPGYAYNGEAVGRSRLRLDTIKWVACKVLPKVYGDKITQEHTGPDGGPIQTAEVNPVDVPKEETYEQWAARKKKELEQLSDVN